MAPPVSESAFTFLPRGAIIQEFKVGGHNIVQSFPTSELYQDAPFFGETIGRTANRIKNGRIDSLNGRSYQLAQNNGPNHLHGGTQGWGKKTFSGPHPVNRGGHEGVQFTYTSPDGEEGYPGTVELRVWYTAYETKEDGISKTLLEVEYEVEMIGNECEETAVSVTNHSYFNLSGSPTITGTDVILETVKYQVIDDTAIPIGPIEDFPGITAGRSFTLGETEPNIDHCFVIDTDGSNVPLDTRARPLTKLVTLSHPSTHLHLEISSTEPAFQFYTGQYVDIPATKDSPAKPPRAGICVEPSRYINAVNVPEWRNQVVVKRGQVWGARSVYKAWKA